jgi:malonate-semialdehyde dehydrogenase (acetylating)/methylmalonate-semialdehyde dehydrogenase
MTLLEEPIKEPVDLRNYIGGQWLESAAEKRDVTNPAKQEVIGHVPLSSRNEMQAAVESAKEAFPAWRAKAPLERLRYLIKWKSAMDKHCEEISRIETMEHGKIIAEALKGTERAIENIEVALGTPSLMMGYNIKDIEPGIDTVLSYEPMGVFGIISPFNFPSMVPLWFAPYAIASGNCVIVKPSPLDPICANKLSDVIEEIDLPPGVWNLVNGDVDASLELIEHPDVKGICFVGSTKVGRDVIAKKCGELGKRYIAQCSAKNPLVVMPDANVADTVTNILPSFFGNSGQRCLSAANLVVVGGSDFYDPFMEKVVAAVSQIKVGYGLDQTVNMGPMQSPAGKERVLGYIEKGLQEGAKLRLDGRKPAISGNYPETCFLGPSIFESVTPDMTIAKEEIFGPVMSVLRLGDVDEAIEFVNGSIYGNGACLFTSNGAAAREFNHRVETGNVGVNIGIPCPICFFPFGGTKDSFFGILHGQGQETMRFFTEAKVLTQRWF